MFSIHVHRVRTKYRATGIYKMTAMGFYDAVKFFSNYSDRDKIIAYAILGGIPHYLRQFRPEWLLYAFGFANFSQLEDGDVDGVYDFVIAPVLHEFASFAFEDVCREFVKELQKNNELPFRYAKMGRWTGKTTVRDKNTLNGLRISDTEIDFKRKSTILLCLIL